jgi:membrane protease YdiL (CAAX protease family)
MKQLNITLKHVLILGLCLVMILFEIVPEWKEIPFTEDKVYNRLISLSIPLLFGATAVILIASDFGIQLFKNPKQLWVLLPALVIALDNLPWLSYFAGNMQLTHTQPLHFVLFGAYCALVGFFEEILFRGIFFSVLASIFEQTKKGFLYTYLISSVAFGVIHLLNVFTSGGAAVLQAGYSILTGGLFGFVWIKTKNIVFPAVIHAIYNFCGLLFTANVGLGTGSVIDMPSGIMMAVISVCIGVLVLYKVWKYPEDEQRELYQRLNVQNEKK